MNQQQQTNAIDLPTFDFEVSIDPKSIIYLALAVIVASLIVMLIARYTKPA